MIEPQNISDYLIRSRFTFYELNDGDILTSLSNKSYLINVYSYDKHLPDYMSFIPTRNFQRKAINCLQLEMPDLNACGSQLIVFKSEKGQVLRPLHGISLLEFIAGDKELGTLNNLLNFCDHKCKSMLVNLTERSQWPRVKSGFTLFLPTNKYFSKSLQNFSKYSKDMSLFAKSLQENIFHGAYCFFYLKGNVIVENLLGKKINSSKLIAKIIDPHAYISQRSFIVHKTDSF